MSADPSINALPNPDFSVSFRADDAGRNYLLVERRGRIAVSAIPSTPKNEVIGSAVVFCLFQLDETERIAEVDA